MKLQSLTPSEQAHVLGKIKELEASDGWKMIQSIMASEREDFFRKLSLPNASTSPDVVNYSRGIIEGTYRLHDLPKSIISTLETSLLIHQSTQAATTPTQQPNQPLTTPST